MGIVQRSIFTLLFTVFAGSASAASLCRLPLANNPGYSAWFDLNAANPGKLRYDCATSFAYEDHHGTDFAAPIGTSVYAAAKGSLYSRTDGCPDDGTMPGCGGSYGNHVRIQHTLDGHVTIYAHLKNGTPVFPQSVLCSAFVGQTGNSGTSSGPHLHFERWTGTGIGTRLDFFSGSCNATGYWVNQNGGFPTTQCQ